MDTYSVSVTPENLEEVQEMMNRSADYMEQKAEELDAEKKNGKWISPIKQDSFTMTKEEFFSKFGRNSSYDEIISQISADHFTLVDLLEAIYKDGDESSTIWRISRQMLHPENIDGMEVLYLSNRGGIWSIDVNDRGNPTIISLRDIIDHFEQSEFISVARMPKMASNNVPKSGDEITVFLGGPGVGKSTIANTYIGEQIFFSGLCRNGKGMTKHCTLHRVTNDTYICDLTGIP